MPNPTSRIERLNPAFCFFLFPFLAFAVMPLILSCSPAIRLLPRTILLVILCNQSSRWRVTLRCSLETLFLCFFHRPEAFIFLLRFGERLRRRDLDAALTFCCLCLRNSGLAIFSPVESVIASLQPRSMPIAPVPVSR